MVTEISLPIFPLDNRIWQATLLHAWKWSWQICSVYRLGSWIQQKNLAEEMRLKPLFTTLLHRRDGLKTH
jgi:hypothetical protein